jgi:transcriptional regulator with XRE-family HTH domain
MPSNDDRTTSAVLADLGRRLEAHRLERNLTQVELGKRAGVGRSTVQKIEGGQTVQTLSLFKVLRALELLEAVDASIPERVELPVMELDRLRQRRQRARQRANDAGIDDQPEEVWTWGDEQ